MNWSSSAHVDNFSINKENQGLLIGLTLHVEYAERGKEYGIRFILSLFCEYIYLEFVRIHIIYRVNSSYSRGCAAGIREYLLNT